MTHWKAAPLRRLIEAEAQAWTERDDERLVLAGPPVMIEARAYQTLALVLHEMMTNAAKYGALSAKTGRLSIEWSLAGSGEMTLEWQESGGPTVTAPSRRGFGSIVVEQSIPFELHGTAWVEHVPEGVPRAVRHTRAVSSRRPRSSRRSRFCRCRRLSISTVRTCCLSRTA